MARICHWDLSIRLTDGRFRAAHGCFQTTPFDEDERDRLRIVNDHELQLVSTTTRRDCYAEDPTKAVVCDLEGGPDTVVTVQLRKPVEKVYRTKLADLIPKNRVEFIGEFTTESLILHRLVAPNEYAATVRWQDRRKAEDGPDWYYVRVVQHNGQLAWSSPIWVG